MLVHAAVTIYPAIAQAGPDLEAALKDAAKTKRRILVDFGGNWCGDCIVLDKYLQEASNADLLRKHYVVGEGWSAWSGSPIGNGCRPRGSRVGVTCGVDRPKIRRTPSGCAARSATALTR